MKTSQQGKAFIRDFEKLRLEAYQDQAGVWTIGYGTTRYPNGQRVRRGEKITPSFALVCFEHDLHSTENVVNSVLPGRLSQQQFDSLVSFAYNVGEGNFEGSTLLKIVRKNPADYLNIFNQLVRWKYVTIDGQKVVSNGLVSRRTHEYKIYKNADYERK